MRRLLLALIVVFLIVVGPVACGRSDGIGGAASARLTPQVDQVRAAAMSGDGAATRQELAELRQTVAELRQTGELSEAEASEVLAASADVEAQLAGTTPASSATGVPSSGVDQGGTSSTTTTAADDGRRGNGNSNGKSDKTDKTDTSAKIGNSGNRDGEED